MAKIRDETSLRISGRAHDELLSVRSMLEAQQGKTVSMSHAVEHLVASYMEKTHEQPKVVHVRRGPGRPPKLYAKEPVSLVNAIMENVGVDASLAPKHPIRESAQRRTARDGMTAMRKRREARKE